MAGVKRFEDLIAWQKARALAGAMYRATATGGFERDFGLRGQITRASASVMSNIAEGFERGTKSEFHQYLVVGWRKRLAAKFDRNFTWLRTLVIYQPRTSTV